MNIKKWVKLPNQARLQVVQFEDFKSFSIQHDTSRSKFIVVGSLKRETQAGVIKDTVEFYESSSVEQAEEWLTDLLGDEVSDLTHEPKGKEKK
jgi:hypothetical protein